MKKSNRAIAICLIFTTLLTFTFKPQKTEAFAGVLIGGGILIAMGILVACGVALTTSDEAVGMSTDLSGVLGLDGNSMELDINEDVQAKVTDFMLNTSKSNQLRIKEIVPAGSVYNIPVQQGEFVHYVKFLGTAEDSFVIKNYKGGSNTFKAYFSNGLTSFGSTWQLTTKLGAPPQTPLVTGARWEGDKYNVLHSGFSPLGDQVNLIENTCDLEVDRGFAYNPSKAFESLPITDGLTQDIVTKLPVDTKVKTNGTTIPKDALVGSDGKVVPESLPVTVTTPIADTPIVDTGWKWLDNILNAILNGILAIPRAISNGFATVKDWVISIPQSIANAVSGLIVPDEFISLDLNPLYVSLEKKFPFCLPYDLYKFVESFKSNYSPPAWEYTMAGFEGPFKFMNGFNFKVDLNDWSFVGAISRFISLAIWCVFLVFLFKRINS